MGKNDDEFGDRFVSMDDAYDAKLREKMMAIANKYKIPVKEGVYLATCGPTFETHAEIKAYKMLGADAVGMSTVPETIVARHCGLRVISVCAITNLAAGLSAEKLSHEGTLRGAAMAVEHVANLFLKFIEEGVK
jgi:xanthosine phosphorylase